MQNQNEKFLSLASKFNELKEIETTAQKERLEVEIELFKLLESQLKGEGTNTFKINETTDFKIVTGITKKYDQDMLDIIYSQYPECRAAFKVEYKEDKKNFSKLSDDMKILLNDNSTITVKKPSFSINIKIPKGV